MTRTPEARPFSAEDAAALLFAPRVFDDKYSRGTVGFVTGSPAYPGAAVLGTSAALCTGVGYVRFVGDDSVAEGVLRAHPEVVTGAGRADVWVVGSGVDLLHRSAAESNRLLAALTSGSPVVIDAGALDLVARATGPAVLTPHARELERVLSTFGQECDAQAIGEHPVRWAAVAADLSGHCVLLKGHQSVIALPGGDVWLPPTGSAWLATAGTGDVLAGALGAILATAWMRREELRVESVPHLLAQCAATAVTLHSRASHLASPPFTASALAETLRDARQEMTQQYPAG